MVLVVAAAIARPDPVTWLARGLAGGDPLVSALAAPARLGAPVTLLVVGSDTRSLGEETGGRYGSTTGEHADVAALVRIDRGEVAILRVPRDLRVASEEHGPMALAAVLEHEGPAGLVTALRRLLGVPIHHYVEVDFDGVAAAVDAIGGLPVDLAAPMRDPKVDLDLPAGSQVLDGAQAVAYLRSRSPQMRVDGEWVTSTGTDVERIVRQQDALESLLAATSTGELPLAEWVDIARRSVTTDRSFTGWSGVLLGWRLRAVDRNDVRWLILPVEAVRTEDELRSPFEPAHMGGLHWLTVRTEEAEAVLAEVFG
jgi:LCP family protein required for cell wall assembly